MIHSESENTACSLMLTTVSSFLFSQHQKGWSKILYLHLDVKQIFDMYSTHSTHYLVQGSFHNSTDCNSILNMPFLPHVFKTILIFTYNCHLRDFSTFVGFFFLISSLLLIKIEHTNITSRFIETAFNLFGVTGDGHINAKVFLDF